MMGNKKQQFLVSDYYLKDWHLQMYLQNHNHRPLYSVPECFGYDLMNEFWTKFGDIITDDYRFVYWGPAGSRTDWHGDILYSYSWSYNVCGVKEWQFEIPGSDRRLRLVQKTGELIFVPSLWRHSVTNVEETISINHNWMTASNVDLVWQSLNAGRQAIDEQIFVNDDGSIDSNTNNAAAAKEKALSAASGGLNVSVFFLMILSRGCQLLLDNNPDWVASYSMIRLRDMMVILLEDGELRERLAATLGDGNDDTVDPTEVIQMAQGFVQSVDERLSTAA